MPFCEKGDLRIRYEDRQRLSATRDSRRRYSGVSSWPTAVFHAMEVFKDDFRCITMDQRNANGGESSGPFAVDDPWARSPIISSG